MIPFGIPEVQNALNALMQAGSEAIAWIQQIMGFEMEARGMVSSAAPEGWPKHLSMSLRIP